MRYHELLGLLDDTFAKYRKEENSPDSKWTPYCYYKNLSDAKNDYSDRSFVTRMKNIGNPNCFTKLKDLLKLNHES